MTAARRFTLLVALVAAAGASWARGRLERCPDPTHELLYLPNGQYLKAMSLGQAPLFADVLYLWAIQYYSDYDRADRYRYVEHIFGSVIAEINPHSIDPYWLGAMILTAEAGDLEGGLRLLDKGFTNNPDQWILPYMAAWECFRAHQYMRAAEYFDRAAAVPGAPVEVMRMRAGMYVKEGDLDEAVRQWQAVLDHPSSDSATRAIAERQLRDLIVRRDLVELRRAVQAFHERTGRNPAALKELIGAELLQQIPRDPDNNPYDYDRRTGEVSSSAGRVLG